MLKISNVTKDYKVANSFVPALKGVNINFRANEFVSILGPSGCGKTTLLNIIGGLDKYTSGDLVIKGQSTKDFKQVDWDTFRNHSIGFVFQSYNLIPHLTVLGNVELALTLAGISSKERKQRAKAVLDRVGLAGEYKKKPNQLSGGQMQRVAIARALVNNPEILLADEPTGALDSETSIQIMELIKEISKERLVIMVTHNPEIAEKYSTRIIRLLDGAIVDDSNPFSDEEELKEVEAFKFEKVEEKASKGKKKKASMSLFTAFTLSMKNLFTKKTRTILTSFAGSIGIIGVALVLAISNGFTNYINQMQRETLGGYPVAVSTVAIDYDALTNMNTSEQSSGGDKSAINVYNTDEILTTLGNYNFISKKFVEHVDNFYQDDLKKDKSKRSLSAVQYSYATNLKLLTQTAEGIISIDNSVSTSSIYGTTSSLFYEGLKDKDFVLENYEVVEGHYPIEKNEVLLVLDATNSLSVQMLDRLGIAHTKTESGYEKIAYTDIAGKKTYKLLSNNQYFKPVYDGENIVDFKTIQKEDYASVYDAAQTLTVCGVMRPKDDIVVELFKSGIMYLPELAEDYCLDCKSSLIATTSMSQSRFFVPFTIKISELSMFGVPVGPYMTPQQIMYFVKNAYNIEMTQEEAMDLGLQMVGASEIPTGVYLYPKDFAGKEAVLNMIDQWNEAGNNKIVYTDPSEVLTGTLGKVINVISYVLIAFAAISLLVSSIMIGIITYVSVVERTKEIGVLRSIGARKRDIARVFNAETFIIGLVAGLLGVVITYILCIPIGAIIENVAGGLKNIAALKLSHAAILIGISVVLTLISGLIPARIASKKDPVVALRTE